MRVVAYGPNSLLKPDEAEALGALLIGADKALETGSRNAAIDCIEQIYRIFDGKVSSVAHRYGEHD